MLPEGEVFTSLTKEAIPVIRYRTRDLTRLLPASPGSSRAMRRIELIKGRSDDMLIIRGVNVFPTQIEAALATEQGRPGGDCSGVSRRRLISSKHQNVTIEYRWAEGRYDRYPELVASYLRERFCLSPSSLFLTVSACQQ